MKKNIIKKIVLPIGIVIVCLICSIISNDYILGGITLIAGFLNAYYMAIGKWYNYIFGIIFNVTYLVACYVNGLYGLGIFTICIYLPLQVYGLINWKKNQQNNNVEAKSFNAKKSFILCFCIILGSFAVGFLLDFIPTQKLSYLDACSQIINVSGVVLGSKAYREAWYVWIANNVIDLTIWTINCINNTPHSTMMLITSIMYLVMNIFGIISWIVLEKKQKLEKSSKP